mmetsp:Transcript_85395/g.228377  ORF Transcript_85395/g.228377 Transcript_85395/m.228377 type:complete len:282 (-) Transcript_85395:906-1751(-)
MPARGLGRAGFGGVVWRSGDSLRRPYAGALGFDGRTPTPQGGRGSGETVGFFGRAGAAGRSVNGGRIARACPGDFSTVLRKDNATLGSHSRSSPSIERTSHSSSRSETTMALVPASRALPLGASTTTVCPIWKTDFRRGLPLSVAFAFAEAPAGFGRLLPPTGLGRVALGLAGLEGDLLPPASAMWLAANPKMRVSITAATTRIGVSEIGASCLLAVFVLARATPGVPALPRLVAGGPSLALPATKSLGLRLGLVLAGATGSTPVLPRDFVSVLSACSTDA